MKRRTSWGPWLLGGALVTMGVLFLLDTTGAVDGLASAWWPLLLIFWGASVQLTARTFSLPATIVLLLGVGFFLEHVDVIGERWLNWSWPVILIVLGIAIVAGAARRRTPRAVPGTTSSDDWFEASVLMAGRKDHVTNRSWRGGRATAVMGGVELDLRDAALAPEGAVLHTTTLMGGVEVTVPKGWEVVLRGTPFLGGFEDKTEHGTNGEQARRPRLEVTGTAVMGGVEVKN